MVVSFAINLDIICFPLVDVLRSFNGATNDRVIPGQAIEDSMRPPTDGHPGLENTPRIRPKRVVRGFHNDRARISRPLHHGIHFGLRGDIVADAEFRGAGFVQRQARVFRQALARPDREFEIGLQIEERYCANLDLRADDPLCGQSESVAIKPQRLFQIVHADREQADARFHAVRI